MGLYAQQHRGQEGAGVVSSDGKELHRHMGQGLVSDVFSNSEVFDSLIGNSAIGHVRYSTTGNSDPKNVGPLTFNMGEYSLSIAHNGNLVNIEGIRKQLQEDGALFQTSTDTEIITYNTTGTNMITIRIVDENNADIESNFSLVVYGVRQ